VPLTADVVVACDEDAIGKQLPPNNYILPNHELEPPCSGLRGTVCFIGVAKDDDDDERDFDTLKHKHMPKALERMKELGIGVCDSLPALDEIRG